MERDLLTVAETAQLLHLSRSRIYELMDANVLASVRIRRARRVYAASVERHLASQAAA